MANDNALPPNDPPKSENPLSNEDSWFLDNVSESAPPESLFDDDALGLTDLPPADDSSTSSVRTIKLPSSDPDDAQSVWIVQLAADLP